MSATDNAVKLLKAELADLDDERKRIESAILALTDKGANYVSNAARARRKHVTPAPKRKPAAKKGGKTQTQKFLDLVAKQPGITVAEAAKSMGVKSNNLYATAANLTKTKRVAKRGPKYYPKK